MILGIFPLALCFIKRHRSRAGSVSSPPPSAVSVDQNCVGESVAVNM